MALNSNFRTLTADNIEGVVSTRNYVRNSFENGALLGWSELSVALTGGLPTGTPTISSTAASSLSLSVTGSTPLSLDKSLLVTVPSSLTAGQGFISDAFILDRMDLGKVITISFDYEQVSGTYNFSGALGSQTWMIYVYDATAGGANWIQPAGFLGMNQSSGPGRVSATFQSSTVANQQYRIAVIASQAAAGASTISFDNFSCSRQSAPIGQLRNPAGTIIATGSLTPPNGYLYCNGSVLSRSDYPELFAAISTSYNTGGETATQFRLPDLRGIFARGAGSQTIGSITYSATLGTKQNDQLQGHWHNINRSDTVNPGGGQLANGAGSASADTYVRNPVTDGTNGTPRTGSETRPANQAVAYHICFSSGSVQMSNDTDTRVVAFSAYDGGGVGVTNTTTLLPMGTTEVDTHAVRSGNTYVVPVSGFYRISAKSTSRFSAGNIANNHALIFYKNGVAQNNGDYGNADAANGSGLEFFFLSINSIVRLNAGDIIDFRYYTNYGGVATTYLKYCSIERLSGPSVIAATENVIAKYSTTAGQAISGTAATIVYATREFDSHGIVNPGTGDITIPISGKYLIGVYGSTASATWASGQQFLWQIRKNGSFSSFINQIRAQAAYTGILESVGPTYIDCLAGDVINIQAQSSVATTLRTAAGTNFFYLVRLGN